MWPGADHGADHGACTSAPIPFGLWVMREMILTGLKHGEGGLAVSLERIWQRSNWETGRRLHLRAADGRDEPCRCLGFSWASGRLCHSLDLFVASVSHWGLGDFSFCSSLPCALPLHLFLPETGIMQNILTVLFKLLALETPFPSASPSQVICAAELGAGKGRDGKGREGRRKRKPFTPPFQPEAGA